VEAFVWVAIGALAGAAGSLAVRGGRSKRLGVIVAATVGALVGGLIVDALIGDVARVRVFFIRGDTLGIVGFGLAPALAASLTAVVAIVALQRGNAVRNGPHQPR
jgi:hypothetical protein